MQIETQETILSYGQIYRITNRINGKSYVGQTTKEDVNDRWDNYKKLDCKRQPKIYNALKKYGPENFLFEVIDASPQNQSQLDDLEILYIAQFNSIKNGYNCMSGGKGGKHSDETKKKLSDNHMGEKNCMFGTHHSAEHKNKISDALKKKNQPLWNRIPDKETRNKISKKLKGRKSSNETKMKISNALLGKIRGPSILKGSHRSEETKIKISQSKKGLLFSNEHKNNLSTAHKGKMLSNETKAKLSKMLKGRKKSEEHKKKISDSLKLRALNKLMNTHLKKIG